jgi:molybdopterin/thiamine biosynthesis adenylyltransferase
MEGSEVKCEFFLGNTRRTRRFLFTTSLFNAVLKLDGSSSLETVAASAGPGTSLDQLLDLCRVLVEACVLEPMDVSDLLDAMPARRVARFLQDYFPGSEVLDAISRLSAARFVILGVGGIGSWVSHLLARSGVGGVVLVDDDVVDTSNLNRSLFDAQSVGKSKVEALADALEHVATQGRMFTSYTRSRIRGEGDLGDLLDALTPNGAPTVLVNCADHPTVDETARVVGRVCLARGIPHVIAGGYNLHLSLVGPTILPFESACVECIRIGLDGFRPGDQHLMKKLARKTRKIGSIGPLVAVGATYVANEAIRAALAGSRIRPAMLNRRAEVNFVTGALSAVDLPRRPDCSWCGTGVREVAE